MSEENAAKSSEVSVNSQEQKHEREEVYTKIVRAGNRTYFFDVKATKKNDLYLTITESKKRFNKDGKFFYEKHKIFLYKEDFDKFANGFEDAIGYITKNLPQQFTESSYKEPVTESKETATESKETVTGDEFINVEFEDLGEK